MVGAGSRTGLGFKRRHTRQYTSRSEDSPQTGRRPGGLGLDFSTALSLVQSQSGRGIIYKSRIIREKEKEG